MHGGGVLKNIAMFGALWTRNFGDVLLADLFKAQVESSGATAIFPTASEQVCKDLKTERGGVKSLIKSDAYLFFGGGYLSEPPKRVLKWAVSRYFRIFFYADLCRLLGKKYYVIGVGAGPCTSRITRFLFKRFCSNAKDIVVRDDESYKTLRGIGVKNGITVACDFALKVKNKNFLRVENKVEKTALHLTSKQPLLNDEIINYFLGNSEFDLWFVEDHPGEFERVCAVNKELVSLVGDRVVRYSSHNSFVETIGNFDFVVTSKLHVGIISAALGKKICSFPYHGKVINFYNSIDRSDLCFQDKSTGVEEHIKKCRNSLKVTLPENVDSGLSVIDSRIAEMIGYDN